MAGIFCLFLFNTNPAKLQGLTVGIIVLLLFKIHYFNPVILPFES